jgi:hypothetical protein
MIILDVDGGTFQIFHDDRDLIWLMNDGPCCGCVVQNLMSMSRVNARRYQHL